MRNPLAFAYGLAAGALLMFYLDARSGARRRALVRDKLLSAGHDAAGFAEAKGRRAFDRLRGVAATGNLHRVTRRPPGSDEQLHERIRARLGHCVSHPRAVEVDVEHGHVGLRGHVLAHEHELLLKEVNSMAGVQSVRDELGRHDDEPALNRALARGDAEEPVAVVVEEIAVLRVTP
jgi:hypothetical protein